MKIAPIDIAHKAFGKKMMGFDPVEVTHFLKSIAEELETLVKERNQLREALREREMAIIEYRDRDELLKNTITTATKMADKIQIDADRESKLIINDANQKAEVIIRDARESLKKIYGEISDLKRIRMQFENNLRALMQSHLSMIDQGHKIMPNPLEVKTQLMPETIEPEKESIKASIDRVVQQKTIDRF